MGHKEEFDEFRTRMNERVLEAGSLELRRFMALDHQIYQDGALPTATKELMGLTASMVLRCDDCITYHVARCHEEGSSHEEIMEAFTVALVVGGSIVIPHMRRAVAFLDDITAKRSGPRPPGSP